MPHFKSTFQIKRNKTVFSNDARFPFTYTRTVCSVIVCVMFCLRRVETESRLFAYASLTLTWFCAQLDFHAYYSQKFAENWFAINAMVHHEACRTENDTHVNWPECQWMMCNSQLVRHLDLSAEHNWSVVTPPHTRGGGEGRRMREHRLSHPFPATSPPKLFSSPKS